MYKISVKQNLSPSVTLMKVLAPLVAQKAQPGQFIIYRIDEYGERIPLTIADTDPENGTVTIFEWCHIIPNEKTVVLSLLHSKCMVI